MTEEEWVNIVLKHLSVEADMKSEIPNAVYTAATAVTEPNTSKCVVFFDMSLADQYGKHSAASKNVVVCRTPILDHSKSPQEATEMLKKFCREAIDELKEHIRSERFVGLFEVNHQ